MATELQQDAATGGPMGLLTGKYKYAMETAKGFHFDGTTDERDGKLYIKGTVATQSQANKIWDALKTIPDWKDRNHRRHHRHRRRGNVHGPGRRYAGEDRKAVARRRECLSRHLRGEPRSALRSQQDQAWPGVEDSAVIAPLRSSARQRRAWRSA
jgi:hypothetical protein